MTPLAYNVAKTFCANFAASGNPADSVSDFVWATNAHKYSEGSPTFDELRDTLLREAERNFYLSFACYASALKCLGSGTVFWSGVSLYYSSFLAAKSLMCLFGCWIESPASWLEVTNTSLGQITLERRRSRYIHTNKKAGSHQVFWDAFYRFSPALTSYVTAEQGIVISPIQNDNYWLIDTRNRINYEPNKSFEYIRDYASAFNPAQIPQSFPGDYGTLIRVSKAFLSLVKDTGTSFNLLTDVFPPAFADRVTGIDNGVRLDTAAELIAYMQSETDLIKF